MAATGIGRDVTVGVVTALILATLTIFGNFVSKGGVVEIFGGVTRKDFETVKAESEATKNEIKAIKTALTDANSTGQPASHIPKDAVLGFLTRDCPSGWDRYDQSVGKVLVGAYPPNIRPYPPSDAYKPADFSIGSVGGTRMTDITILGPPNGGGQPQARVPAVMVDSDIVLLTNSASNAARYSLIPPYVAVSFCVQNR